MRRWHSFLEIIQFPLRVLYVSIIFMGIGGFLLNSNVTTLIPINNSIVILFAEIMRYFGGIMIMYFPLLILIKALSKRYEDSVPVFIGIIGYIVFHVVTMFFASRSLTAATFYPFLGIQVNLSKISLAGTGMLYPLQTGIIAAVINIFITRFAYRRSRGVSGYGVLSFIDRDSWAAISTIIYSVIAAIVISFIWPFFMGSLTFVFRFIASDITNPINLFVYGIFDRLLSIANLSTLIRQPFWFGTFGGSWIDAFGNNYVGDVAIWTAQQAQGIFTQGFGRLITPYYVLNIFAIPAFLLGAYQTFTDKFEKRKYRLFLFIASALSILFGTLLPVELFMLIAAPLLFVFHILYTGILFALFEGFSVAIGYTFSGLEMMATPASIIDVLIYIRNPVVQRSVMTIASIGVFTFFVYLFMTTLYYRKIAIDIMNIGEKSKKISAVLDVFGGVSNLRMVHSTPNKLTILPFDKTKIEFSKANIPGVYRIVESKAGYSMYMGASSFILRTELIKKMKEYQRQILESNQ